LNYLVVIVTLLILGYSIAYIFTLFEAWNAINNKTWKQQGRLLSTFWFMDTNLLPDKYLHIQQKGKRQFIVLTILIIIIFVLTI